MKDSAAADPETEGAQRWRQACLALSLLAMAPGSLKGMVIRARSGPVRDAFLARLSAMPLPLRRIHPDISDEALFGGLDLAATLSSGHLVETRGLAAEPAALVLAMAERCPNDTAAKLAQLLDRDAGHCLIALDEGAERDELCPPPLAERLAFHVDLDGLSIADCHDAVPLLCFAGPIPGGRDRAIAPLTALAARFGIDSLRAPQLALQAAMVHALGQCHDAIGDDDVAAAAALVYPHRATMMPEAPEEEAPEDETPPPEEDASDTGEDDAQAQGDEIPDEMLIEAMKALLPDGLLDHLGEMSGKKGPAGAGGAGQRKKGNRRGRPLPSRPGRLDGRNRLDLVATLRAAAPWQTIRERQVGPRPGLHIRPSDIRIKRFEERSDRLLIFAVDASGSAAMARLGEAKGAVELLLAEAYANRDHVALVAFRGEAAELLLPPTRSLVQTKRRLASLPGGGGTPLAAGLRAAMDLGVLSRGKGLTPTLAVLTDGRANIALDGSANRAQAGADATRIGRCLRAEALPAILLDTGNRPTPALQQLAAEMAAPYLPLPRADAQKISSAVSDALA